MQCCRQDRTISGAGKQGCALTCPRPVHRTAHTHSPPHALHFPMRDCHAPSVQHAQQELRKIPSSFIFLCPDMVIMEGRNSGEREKGIRATSTRLISFQAGGEFKKNFKSMIHFLLFTVRSIQLLLQQYIGARIAQTQGKVSLTSASKVCLTLGYRSFSSKCNGRDCTYKCRMQLCSWDPDTTGKRGAVNFLKRNYRWYLHNISHWK